jgi:hypothetical protein
VIRRDPSSTSTTMKGDLAGANMSQGGFTSGLGVRALNWGEVTGGSNCPDGPALGKFGYWQKLKGTTWSFVAGANVSNYHSGIPGPCWSVTSLSSTGYFNVQR